MAANDQLRASAVVPLRKQTAAPINLKKSAVPKLGLDALREINIVSARKCKGNSWVLQSVV
jgi:hypothetical protein